MWHFYMYFFFLPLPLPLPFVVFVMVLSNDRTVQTAAPAAVLGAAARILPSNPLRPRNPLIPPSKCLSVLLDGTPHE